MHRSVARSVAAVARFALAHAQPAGAFLASSASFVWASMPAARRLNDDAAITYAYGMNLGRFGQLAPNLEGMAVEGFSNPLNVLIVAILSALHCFHPIATHQYLDIATFGLIGLFAFLTLRNAFEAAWWTPWLGAALFLGLEVCTPATLVWYGSGLENGQLSAALLVLLWRLQVGVARGFSPSVDGTLLVATALIRPEAPLYCIVWLVAAGFLVAAAGMPLARRLGHLRALMATAVVLAACLAILAVVRYALFASHLPNTFYAKVDKADVWQHFADYVRPSLASYWYSAVLWGSVVALFVSNQRGAFTLAMPLLLLSCAALALPLAVGEDWMGHHRFATAFLMLGHFSFAAVCCAAWDEAARRGPSLVALSRAIAICIPAAAVSFLFLYGRDQYRSFLKDWYVSFASIADVEGFERVRLQRYLGMFYPVVALPDAGGSSVVGSMQLVDTAWLLDYHMSRIRNVPELVARYQHDERRVDLAEYHAWSFDRSLIGSTFLAAAALDAEADYPGFRPSYGVRRDLVEAGSPGLASVRLGANREFEVYLADRTVLIGAPNATLRVELLLLPRVATWDPACRVQVIVPGSSEVRRVFVPSPLSDTAFVAVPGRYYRQGFLVQLPSRPGDYALQVELCADADTQRFNVPAPVMVRSPETLSLADLRHGLGASRDWMAEARWTAELREQLVPRLPPETYVRSLTMFRASYRDQSRTNLGAYDALIADTRPAFLDEMPEAVRALEREVVAGAGERASRMWADHVRPVGARTLAVARVVDDLRRLGFLGVASSQAMGAVMREILRAPESNDDRQDAYAQALGLALLLPGKAIYQRRLAERRTLGLALPESDRVAGQ